MQAARRWAMVSVPVLASLASGAQAHPLAMHAAGFAAGLAHPFLGLDHLAAMLAVGLWAAQLGGRARLLVPLAFVTMMAVGAALAVSGVRLPAVEPAIGASVLVLGLLIAFAARLPLVLGLALTGAFALFHGHAHGSELPQAAAPLLYAGGFLLATAALHAAGLVAGSLLRGRYAWLVRAAGAVLAGSGLLLLAG